MKFLLLNFYKNKENVSQDLINLLFLFIFSYIKIKIIDKIYDFFIFFNKNLSSYKNLGSHPFLL